MRRIDTIWFIILAWLAIACSWLLAPGFIVMTLPLITVALWRIFVSKDFLP